MAFSALFFFYWFSLNTKSILCVHNSQNQPCLPQRLDFQPLHCHGHNGKARKQSMGWRGGKIKLPDPQGCCLLGQCRAASELLFVNPLLPVSLGRTARTGSKPGHNSPARVAVSGARSRGSPAQPLSGGTGGSPAAQQSWGTGNSCLTSRELGLEVGSLRESFLFTAH